jgi:hypothetical protein
MNTLTRQQARTKYSSFLADFTVADADEVLDVLIERDNMRDSLCIALDALRHIKQQADAECVNVVALSQECERAIKQAGGRP